MTQPKVLTIAEAQAALNLSGARVHQLLADGELDGPPLPAGRRRHSPGAPRVTSSSLDRYLRKTRQEQATPQRHAPQSTTAASGTPDVAQADGAGAAPARAATQELKVRLDAMREELVAERNRSLELLDVVEKMASLLRGVHVSAQRLDGITDGYSEALTQLLTPDAPDAPDGPGT